MTKMGLLRLLGAALFYEEHGALPLGWTREEYVVQLRAAFAKVDRARFSRKEIRA